MIKRRLWRFIHGDKPVTIKPANKADSGQDEDTEIYIRYIFCSFNFFANDVGQMKLYIKPSVNLNEVTRMICSENKIPQEETIELYSSHGYPLQNNGITGQGNLFNFNYL